MSFDIRFFLFAEVLITDRPKRSLCRFVRVEQLLPFLQSVAIGHTSDVVGDDSWKGGFSQLFLSFFGQHFGFFEIGLEYFGDEAFGFGLHTHEAMVAVHVLEQELF
jgi:hypothetical protein